MNITLSGASSWARRLRPRPIRRKLHHAGPAGKRGLRRRYLAHRRRANPSDAAARALLQAGEQTGHPGFDKAFLEANRSGFYAQVLEEGQVVAGDPIVRVRRDPVGMTVAQVNAALLLDKNPAAAERALRLTALSPEWRGRFEKLLARA